jgi:stalled ribosome alternative rescue factor ArfA
VEETSEILDSEGFIQGVGKTPAGKGNYQRHSLTLKRQRYNAALQYP